MNDDKTLSDGIGDLDGVKCEVACSHCALNKPIVRDLRVKLNSIMAERDLLLCEVSRLKFELEIADLKRINLDGCDKTTCSCSPTGSHYTWACKKAGYSFNNNNNNNEGARSRLQVYELSQDLLDKQIEMLERKYGGDRARRAAVTIQRAFRHYTLVKKFAAITAMAKAEKRVSRRLLGFPEEGDSTSIHYPGTSNGQPQASSSNLPVRSLSMREKRNVVCECTVSLPRSHSGRCELEYCSVETTTEKHYMNLQESFSSSIEGMEQNDGKNKVPPEVPKRTSSMVTRLQEAPGAPVLNKNSDSGSVSSVLSSGSDSSVLPTPAAFPVDLKKQIAVVPEVVRKRQYRVGLNLFNKKPEKGIAYLVKRGFLDNSPQTTAHFLISRKGLSKQMIGEFLGNLQEPFNSAVLEYFAQEIDLSGMQIDVALRKYQTYFRMPGEAQKVERLIEVFSRRYCQCNRDMVQRLQSLDTVFVLAFAIIMLNTDLHTPSIKPERRMNLEEFIKNLRGVDDCCDIDRNMLTGIYERVKSNEFKPGSDHVSQVLKVQSTIVGKKPNLALPHRRLVCYCRLYEVHDVNKKERPGLHQREVFLFNDLLVITKLLSKKKNSITYTFRDAFSLSGLAVSLFELPHYPYGIKIVQRVNSHVLIIFNARNDHDRCKFVEDMRESICEMDEMESLRIEAELEKQKSQRNGRAVSCHDNRDSGVADIEMFSCVSVTSDASTPTTDTSSNSVSKLKRSALSNSLLDMHEQSSCSLSHFSESPQPLYSMSLDQSDSM